MFAAHCPQRCICYYPEIKAMSTKSRNCFSSDELCKLQKEQGKGMKATQRLACWTPRNGDVKSTYVLPAFDVFVLRGVLSWSTPTLSSKKATVDGFLCRIKDPGLFQII
nr:unnamed protein product [Spirometra erinaceieuropaei]